MSWLLLLIVLALMLGPIGQLSLTQPLTPNLLVVFLWAMSWFHDRNKSLRLAIAGGLLLDFVSWSYFGLWSVSMIVIVLILNLLKERWLDTSSLLHALVALASISLMVPLLLSLLTKTFFIHEIILAVLGNVISGAVVYYLLAMRLSMFQRWAGRRIE